MLESDDALVDGIAVVRVYEVEEALLNAVARDEILIRALLDRRHFREAVDEQEGVKTESLRRNPRGWGGAVVIPAL